MVLRRSHIIILVLLALVLAGCFRQASAPAEDVDSPVSTPLQQQPPAAASETPTVPPIVVITSTPAVQLSPTSLPEQPMATATPTLAPPVMASATPEGGSVSGPAPMYTASPTPTQQFVTPGTSQNSVASTPTPLAVIATVTQMMSPTPALSGAALDQCVYTVEAGDNLFRIAVNHGFTLDEITAANPDINPTLIRPGDEIILPNCQPEPLATQDAVTGSDVIEVTVAPQPTVHIVQSGETLGAIARRYGVTVISLINANNLTDPDKLSIGQQLIIPPVEP